MRLGRSNYRNMKGVITVYLSLSLMIIVSLILALISSARDKSLRMRAEIAMDMGMQSIFAEYNRKLLEEYDLYFIDSSYGGKEGDAYYTNEHLKHYLDKNLNTTKGQFVLFGRDLFGLYLDDSQIDIFSLASDSGADVYKRQAIHAMKDRYGVSIVEELKKNTSSYKKSGIPDYDIQKKREESRKAIEGAYHARDDEGNSIEFEDPTKDIEKQRSVMLDFLVGQGKTSQKTVDVSNLSSSRKLKSGSGIIENSENLDSITSNLLFDMYILDKFSCYTRSVEHDGLAYEIEYILNGKKSDTENLKKTAEKLLLLRETSNCISAFSNDSITSQAATIAKAISAIILMPELAEPLKIVIVMSWAFAEACVDVSTLLNGGKVPLLKGQDDWVLTSFLKALNFRAYMNKKTNGKDSGMDYSMYLGLFLTLSDKDKEVFRSIDMIENDLRHMVGNSHFKIDNCIEYIEAQVQVKSLFGYDYIVRRYFGYESMPQMTY